MNKEKRIDGTRNTSHPEGLKSGQHAAPAAINLGRDIHSIIPPFHHSNPRSSAPIWHSSAVIALFSTEAATLNLGELDPA